MVDQSQLDQDLNYIAIGQDEGASSRSAASASSATRPASTCAPALFTETTNDMRINREEIFGPVATVIRVKDYDEALARRQRHAVRPVRRHLHHLAEACAAHFKRNAQAGMVMVNLPTAGVDYHVPFGGRKGSSYGPREQGRYAAEFYTTVKTAYTLP